MERAGKAQQGRALVRLPLGASRIWSPHGAKLAALERGFAQCSSCSSVASLQEEPCGSLGQTDRRGCRAAREVHPLHALDECPGRTGEGVCNIPFMAHDFGDLSGTRAGCTWLSDAGRAGWDCREPTLSLPLS